jgi:predicted transcriptional regulator of viral defense system
MIPLAKIQSMLRKRGPMRARELLTLGMQPEQVRRLVGQGVLEKRGRGIYVLPEQYPGEHSSLAEACLRSPRAVVCLISALAFHGIGTQLPRGVWLALPKGAHAPDWDDLGVKVVHLGPKYLEADVETHKTPDGTVRVYSVARTIVDLFRFRGSVGLDVFLEAAREAVRERRTTWDQIFAAARFRGVSTSIRPYLEAM